MGKNDIIRAHAGSLSKRYFESAEDIVAAVEEELGWSLSEREQEIAVAHYYRKRSEVLAG